MSAPVKRRALPVVVPPAARGHVLDEHARPQDVKWKPTYVVWELTLQCDLLCTHCGSRAGKARPDELSTEEALDVVRQLKEMGTHEVTIIGGEAYLRDDWLTIARAITAGGMKCSMTTGGRKLDADKARGAKAAGIRLVSVSVDGLEDTHDRLRAVTGSYRAAIAAIGHVKDAGMTPSANTQVCAQNLREIEPLFDVLADAGIRHWQVQVTVAMGRAADAPASPSETLLLEPFQMLEVLAILHRLKPRAQARGVKIWPGNNVGYFGPYESEIRDMYPTGHMYSCGAGRSSMGIEANGAIKGCPSLPSKDYVGGNVRDYELVDVWQRSEALRFTRDRTVEKDLWGFCRDCYYADSCRAGCSWTSHVLLGRPGNQPFCHHRAIELLKIGQRERIVQTAPPPGTPFDAGRYEIVVEEWPEEERKAALALVETGEGWLSPHATSR